MKSLSLIFLFLFLVSCSSSDRKIRCGDWKHPNVKVPIPSRSIINDIDKNIKVGLMARNIQIEPAWSEEKLKANGFVGNNLGVSLVRIPEAGNYIVWINKKAFVAIAKDGNFHSGEPVKSLPAKRYIEGCEEQVKNEGFLRAVEFSFEEGIYYIQFSHAEESVLIYQVTKRK